jgi:Domain of unknown function (DUF1083).
MSRSPIWSAVLGAACLAPFVVEAKPSLEIGMHDPCNLFQTGESVAFPVSAQDLAPGEEFSALVTDWRGREVWKREVPNQEGKASLEIGILPNGYYELAVQAGETSAAATFGVVTMVDRTAEEARAGGYRFGLKMGGYRGKFDAYKAMGAAARLGLQWTRETFNWKIEELSALPVNIVYKVEKFPPEAYDEARYGPRKEFRLREFGWSKATVPLEEPYKRWLKEEIAKLPEAADLFEIWNEAWGKLPPADFAKVAQWTKDAIREVRPEARVGPNLGVLDYDVEFIDAGGMDGMDVLFLHPYGHAERRDLRAVLRRIRTFYEQRGYHVTLHVTEFGSSTPPKGPHSGNTERNQARQAVRAALAFFAEDVKSFSAHCLGQLEKEPANRDQWYGFFRDNAQPKPVLVAMAHAARRIDGSRYAGDLFLQPDVGARLFEKDGVHTLVLWTNDLEIPMEIDVGVPEVTLSDVVGAEKAVRTRDGRLSLALSGDPVYVVGVSPSLEDRASKELWDGQWVAGRFVRGERVARRMTSPPSIDGRVEEQEWKGHSRIPLSAPRVDKADASATGYVAWDASHLYVAAVVRDDDPFVNTQPPFTAYLGDSVELFVGSDVKRQIPEFVHTHDQQMIFAPISQDGRPVAGGVNRNERRLDGIEGLRMASVKTTDGWSMELAIPLSYFRDFLGEPGHIAAFEMRVNDVDTERDGDRGVRFKIDPADGGCPNHLDATVWSTLQLVE